MIDYDRYKKTKVVEKLTMIYWVTHFILFTNSKSFLHEAKMDIRIKMTKDKQEKLSTVCKDSESEQWHALPSYLQSQYDILFLWRNCTYQYL